MGIALPGDGSAQFSFSDDGSLMYVAGHGGFQTVSMYWMDREGKFTPMRELPGDYYNPAFSPDGKRVALQINDGKGFDIWVYEWERDTLTHLTFGEGLRNISPVWTPDGQRIIYSSLEPRGESDLYWKRAYGTGEALRLTATQTRKLPSSWSPDGKVLLFDQLNTGTSWNIFIMFVEGNEKLGWKPGEPKQFLKSPFTEQGAAFSPDGRWVAYKSFESGIFEVYVRPFPEPGGKWQISTNGGASPKWSRNGKELFYRTQENKIMVATYTASGNSFHAGRPQLWSPGQFTDRLGLANFDLHPMESVLSC